MHKLWKRLLGLAAIGSAAAGIFYYFKKTKTDDEEDFDDDLDDVFENEDFDLDNDLKPVSDRGYVPLTPKTDSEEDIKDEDKASDSDADNDSTSDNNDEAVAAEGTDASAE